MPRAEDDKAFQDKLSEIGKKLLANPRPDDVKNLQLHIDALQKWAWLAKLPSAAYHDHDHMDDHDHAMPSNIGTVAVNPAGPG